MSSSMRLLTRMVDGIVGAMRVEGARVECMYEVIGAINSDDQGFDVAKVVVMAVDDNCLWGRLLVGDIVIRAIDGECVDPGEYYYVIIGAVDDVCMISAGNLVAFIGEIEYLRHSIHLNVNNNIKWVQSDNKFLFILIWII